MPGPNFPKFTDRDLRRMADMLNSYLQKAQDPVRGGTGLNSKPKKGQILAGDGEGSYNLEDLPYWAKTYTTANFALGTTITGAFADVHTTDAALPFYVTFPGRYRVEFLFNNFLELNSSLNASLGCAFRLIDEAGTASSALATYFEVNSAATPGAVFPVALSYVFNVPRAILKTVRLQFRNTHSANAATNDIIIDNATNRILFMRAYRIASAA